MMYIGILLLLYLSASLFLDRPIIKVEIKHNTSEAPVKLTKMPEQPEQPEQPEPPISMDAVIQTINDLMGVNYEEEQRR